jgi:hypothetical protein
VKQDERPDKLRRQLEEIVAASNGLSGRWASAGLLLIIGRAAWRTELKTTLDFVKDAPVPSPAPWCAAIS